jgi:hypothetical protein
VFVLVGGLTVDPEGFQAGVASEFDNSDEVFATADELGDVGVPAGVGGRCRQQRQAAAPMAVKTLLCDITWCGTTRGS